MNYVQMNEEIDLLWCKIWETTLRYVGAVGKLHVACECIKL
jgi:hypothetical protein